MRAPPACRCGAPGAGAKCKECGVFVCVACREECSGGCGDSYCRDTCMLRCGKGSKSCTNDAGFCARCSDSAGYDFCDACGKLCCTACRVEGASPAAAQCKGCAGVTEQLDRLSQGVPQNEATGGGASACRCGVSLAPGDYRKVCKECQKPVCRACEEDATCSGGCGGVACRDTCMVQCAMGCSVAAFCAPCSEAGEGFDFCGDCAELCCGRCLSSHQC